MLKDSQEIIRMLRLSLDDHIKQLSRFKELTDCHGQNTLDVLRSIAASANAAVYECKLIEILEAISDISQKEKETD